MDTLKNLKVKNAYSLVDDNPIILKVTEDFSQVISDFAHHVDLRGIFVVDEDNRLLGVITRTDLLDWARAKLGVFLLKPITEMEKGIRVVRLIRATSVGDILRLETKNAAIHETDTLDHALSIMVDMDLILLPVIDESHHLIGSLSLSELLNIALTEN